jgi:hypothetical protein
MPGGQVEFSFTRCFHSKVFQIFFVVSVLSVFKRKSGIKYSKICSS